MWKEALDNRVKYTPRAEDDDGDERGRDTDSNRGENGEPRSSNGEVVIHPSAEVYFENLAKKFRHDDGSRPVLTPKLNNEFAQPSSSASLRRLPFEGVVVFISKKVDEQRELIRAVERLGGTMRYQVQLFT